MSEAQKRPRQPSKSASEKKAETNKKDVGTAGKFAGYVLQSLTRSNFGTVFKKMDVTTTFVNANVISERTPVSGTFDNLIYGNSIVVASLRFEPKVVREHKKKKKAKDKAKVKEPVVPSDPLTVQLVLTENNTLTYLIGDVDLDTEEGLKAMNQFMTGKPLADMLSGIKLNSRTNDVDLSSLATKLYTERLSDIKSTIRKYVRIQHATQSALNGDTSHIVGIEQIF